MIAIADLHGTARDYLRAAKLLRTRHSYDAAVYLCGYAVEIALKARICRTLKWRSVLKTHNLKDLLGQSDVRASDAAACRRLEMKILCRRSPRLHRYAVR